MPASKNKSRPIFGYTHKTEVPRFGSSVRGSKSGSSVTSLCHLGGTFRDPATAALYTACDRTEQTFGSWTAEHTSEAAAWSPAARSDSSVPLKGFVRSMYPSLREHNGLEATPSSSAKAEGSTRSGLRPLIGRS